MVPLKRLVNPTRPITYGIVQAGPDFEGGVPYVRPVDMTQVDGVADPSALLRTDPGIATAYQRSTIEVGDVVISIGPSFGKVMVVPASLSGANLTQGTARVAPALGVSSRYLYWALQTALATAHWTVSVGGATFRALNLGPLALTPVPTVEPARQALIAEFLDRETERIDAVVAKKRRMIDLLDEERTALITHTVTKGLDPTAPMKDSGIPWLGDIPAHWRVATLGRMAIRVSDGPFGSALKSDHYAEDGVRVIRLGNVGETKFLAGDEAYLPEVYANELSGFRVEPGDLVMAGLGDERRALGRAFVVSDELRGAVHKADCYRIILSAATANPHYMATYLSSGAGAAAASASAQGTTRQRLNTEIAARLPVLVPPLVEQGSIADAAREIGNEVGRISNALTAQLTLLSEYRQALITSAVTGRLSESVLRGEVPIEEAVEVPA